MLFNSLKYKLSKFVEYHPYLWFISWTLIHKFSFLLPHDKSYYALKHFCYKQNNLFLDIGANSGISALSFRKLNNKIPIFSIEPNPIHFESLSKHKAKLAPFDFMINGLGNVETELTLYTPRYNNVSLHTFTSIEQQQVVNAVQSTFGPKVSKKIVIDKLIGKIITLDSLNIMPSIIKMDAEGYEYNILLGSKKTIELHRPFLMLEACHSDMSKILGYFDDIRYVILGYNFKNDRFSYYSPHAIINSSGNRNIFAVPREELSLLPVDK